MKHDEFDDFFYDLKDNYGCQVTFDHKALYYAPGHYLGGSGWYKSLSDLMKSGRFGTVGSMSSDPDTFIVYTAYSFNIYYPNHKNLMDFDIFKGIVDDIEVVSNRLKDEVKAEESQVKIDSNHITLTLARPSIQLNKPLRVLTLISQFNRKWGQGNNRTDRAGSILSRRPIAVIQIQCIINGKRELEPSLLLNIQKTKGADNIESAEIQDMIDDDIKPNFDVEQIGNQYYLKPKGYDWYTLL